MSLDTRRKCKKGRVLWSSNVRSRYLRSLRLKMNNGKRSLILQRFVAVVYPSTRCSLVYRGVPDKIEKALRNLSDKERQRLKIILAAIKDGRLDGLDVVKLKGYDDIYRVRKGDLRIIFRWTRVGIIILPIERLSDTPYN